LNSLIGSDDIESEFLELLRDYPKILNVIPILLAKRENEIFAMDDEGSFCYDFKKANQSPEQYADFMKKTGLFDLISKQHVNNLYDYVLGIETGLDSNARKNRGGHLMEKLVEEYIKKTGFEYNKEMRDSEILKKYGVDLSNLTNNGDVTKRFDFVIKTKNYVYGIETNFYNSSGSKLNETARSYKMLAMEAKDHPKFRFVWITDGDGWKDAEKNLKETFDVLERMYNIQDLENGVLKQLE
jgi:type II restriction enzyme